MEATAAAWQNGQESLAGHYLDGVGLNQDRRGHCRAPPKQKAGGQAKKGALPLRVRLADYVVLPAGGFARGRYCPWDQWAV